MKKHIYDMLTIRRAWNGRARTYRRIALERSRWEAANLPRD